jgi:pyridoxamine 5'-phosphate oxidase
MSDTTQSIADLRKSYERAELSEDASHADPLKQFGQWLQEAITGKVPEPNAMTLATVGSNLRPSTRVVLVKGYDERGIVWYTNYDSRKGQELAGNPFAALQFHWVELERTVRIEGRVEKVSDEESDAYFHSRPLDSRIGAWASPQSQVIPGPHGAGDQRGQIRRAVSAEPAAPTALGRLPAGARCLAVLAGPQKPPARQAALHTAGRRQLAA